MAIKHKQAAEESAKEDIDQLKTLLNEIITKKAKELEAEESSRKSTGERSDGGHKSPLIMGIHDFRTHEIPLFAEFPELTFANLFRNAVGAFHQPFPLLLLDS